MQSSEEGYTKLISSCLTWLSKKVPETILPFITIAIFREKKYGFACAMKMKLDRAV
jgi:hypothetical protein